MKRQTKQPSFFLPSVTWLLAFLFWIAVVMPTSYADVVGNAFLTGQTNHQGIKVLFNVISITGQSDSTTTDSTGAYSINLQPGVYEITFSKANYNSLVYEDGGSQQIVLTGNDTLADVTLLDLTVKYVSGSIKDTLYADTIYVAVGDLGVSQNNHLYLEAGTQLRFDGNYKLTCLGNFDAVGTSSQPVTITTNQPNAAPSDWDVLEIRGGSDTTKIHYCQVSGSDEGVWIEDVLFADVRYSTFSQNNNELQFRGQTSGRIVENEFTQSTGNSILLRTGSNTEVEVACNYIHHSLSTGLYAIESEADLDIHNNTFFQTDGQYAGNVSLWIEAGDVLMEENVCLNSTTTGLALLLVDSTQGTVLIQHNLITGHNTGVFLRAADGGSVFQMNSIFGNTNYQVAQPYPPGGTPGFFGYNHVQGPNPFYTVNIVGLGIPITTNANGSAVDAYLNISDSLLYNPAFGLFPPLGNPLVNAGNPSAPLEADSSIADIGIRPSLYCPTPFQGLNSRVYPGDANSNYTADAWDLLPIGQFYGTTGNPRSTVSNAWMGFLAPDWGIQMLNGLDIKHADCNGDGIINELDTAAIQLNYQSTHNGNRIVQSTNGTPLYFDLPAGPHYPGDTLLIPIHLGTMDTPAVAVYGMAMGVSYDSSIVVPGTAELDFSGSWVGSLNADMIALQKDLFPESKIEFSFTRTDQMDANGYGKIADLIIVLDEDISKMGFPLTLDFENALLQDHEGIPSPTNGMPGTIQIDTLSQISTSIEPEANSPWQIMPNPARDFIFIQSPNHSKVDRMELWSLDGKLVLMIPNPQANTPIQLPPSLNNGIYLVRMLGEAGQLTTRIQLIR